jgi:hypothetical protein
MAKNLGKYNDGADDVGYADHVTSGRHIPMTNNSGASVSTGDALVVDPSADESVTTTTTEAENLPVVVVPADITDDNVSGTYTVENAAEGWFQTEGYVPAVNVDSAVSRGEYLTTSTTAGSLTGSGLIVGTDKPTSGCVAIALEAAGGAGSIAALLMPLVDPPAAVSDYAPVIASDVDKDLVDITTGTAYATILSTTLAANTLGTDKGVLVEAWGRMDFDGNAWGALVRLTYGTTVLTSDGIAASGTATNRYLPIYIFGVVMADGATNDQELFVTGMLHEGDHPFSNMAKFGAAAEDSTSDLALKLEIAAYSSGNHIEIVAVRATKIG